MLRAVGAWRLWAPAIGVAAGAAVAGAFGLYDTAGVAEADWVGLPAGGWAGLDLGFGPAFWILLPAFVFVALADAVKAVGVVVGVVFVALAFLPKFMALIIAVPGPVVGAYLAVLMATLFVLGMRMVVEDGADYRTGVVAGVSFWIGLGFEHQLVLADYLGTSATGLLGNGVTTGGLAAILMTLFVELTKPRRRRIGTELDLDAYPTIDAFLSGFAASRGWSEAMTDRLRAVGEETLATLVGGHDDEPACKPRRLLLAVRNDGRAAELEFVTTTEETNIEDRLAFLGDRIAGERLDREVSLRLLRHLASSVRHQQFHDTEVVTVRVEPVSR